MLRNWRLASGSRTAMRGPASLVRSEDPIQWRQNQQVEPFQWDCPVRLPPPPEKLNPMADGYCGHQPVIATAGYKLHVSQR
jgi:hypothetical protein